MGSKKMKIQNLLFITLLLLISYSHQEEEFMKENIQETIQNEMEDEIQVEDEDSLEDEIQVEDEDSLEAETQVEDEDSLEDETQVEDEDSLEAETNGRTDKVLAKLKRMYGSKMKGWNGKCIVKKTKKFVKKHKRLNYANLLKMLQKIVLNS